MGGAAPGDTAKTLKEPLSLEVADTSSMGNKVAPEGDDNDKAGTKGSNASKDETVPFSKVRLRPPAKSTPVEDARRILRARDSPCERREMRA